MDRYTKGVLTVIAGALCVLAAQNAISPAQSQAGLQRVVICDVRGQTCANVVADAPGVRSSGGTLAVRAADPLIR
ncbi:hypothetical protein [Plastoroseomonas hellenica]|uniref:Uncharacterized protein n=1 Tax=Plastoroseomonas hellenica TaxID=2687306 RepID=A0ABS5F7U0_9PROT|nr:hypothetical protein [Plastoroseomonas hellenica]MBR0646704.1 hypothetical protein [Plastoroseomonas hellenica]MBR0668629.1 hypothetical protein [Plastoroseomonas hellenica]